MPFLTMVLPPQTLLTLKLSPTPPKAKTITSPYLPTHDEINSPKHSNSMNPTPKIYPSSGDLGHTTLSDNTPVSKSDSRIIASGDVSELASFLALTQCNHPFLADKIKTLLSKIQTQLLDLSKDLLTPCTSKIVASSTRITQADLTYLEEMIYHLSASSDKNLIPSPSSPLALNFLHACNLSLRAERSTWSALEQNYTSMNALTGKYLNRLSDLLTLLGNNSIESKQEITSPSPLSVASNYEILVEL